MKDYKPVKDLFDIRRDFRHQPQIDEEDRHFSILAWAVITQAVACDARAELVQSLAMVADVA